MDEQAKQDIIRYLRGMIDNLESGVAELVHFEQERDYLNYDNGAFVERRATGGRIETIHWRPKNTEH